MVGKLGKELQQQGWVLLHRIDGNCYLYGKGNNIKIINAALSLKTFSGTAPFGEEKKDPAVPIPEENLGC